MDKTTQEAQIITGLIEDRRLAVSFSVGLGLLFILCSTLLLVGTMTLILYIKILLGHAYLPVLACLCFVLSNFFGAIAISKARHGGFKGDWNIEYGRYLFDLQSILIVIGFVLILLTVWIM